jgi:serine protease Do
VFIKPDVVTGGLKRDLVNRHGAKVLSYDLDLDLALLRIKDFHADIAAVELADPGEIMVGEEVVAIGHPEQGGLWSLTYGRISGQITDQSGGRGKDVFETDTSVNRGNSGGPLLDGRGYMVGVNTNIARLGKDDLPITGVNFAVKSSVVRRWLGSKGYTVEYGSIPLDESARGPEAAKPVTVPVPAKDKLPEPAPLKDKPAVKVPEPEEELSLGMERAGEGDIMSDTILTPKRPITHDELFEEVERELEDLMEEMRKKIRR